MPPGDKLLPAPAAAPVHVGVAVAVAELAAAEIVRSRHRVPSRPVPAEKMPVAPGETGRGLCEVNSRPWLSRWRWPTRLAAPLRRAYRRGDLFEKRRKRMDAWARYCAELPQTGAVLIPAARMICGAPTRSSGAPGGVFLVPATPAVATAMPTSQTDENVDFIGAQRDRVKTPAR